MNISTFLALPGHTLFVLGILLILILLFVSLFLIPALRFRFLLKSINTSIQSEVEAHRIEVLDEAFNKDKTLAHLWSEFKETLHYQRDINTQNGALEVCAIRSTVPAEAFFSETAVISSRLRTEFFKHLPGILTGIGIIGTFLGLMIGLEAFQISEDPKVVRASLDLLLHGVFQAFTVSATAIILAMAVTFAEKWLVASLYRMTEELCFLIDSMFEAGAGEEYLARLVKASEDSADQSKILKDALIKELDEILTRVTEKQITATAVGNQQLGQQIVDSLTNSLAQPLQGIAEAVQVASKDRGDAVTQLLTDVLAGFSQRLQELFGGQISGINQMQQQTIDALQAAVTKLQQMASSVEEAGTRSTDAMTQRLTAAMEAMEGRQQALNDNMTAFVQQISKLVSDSQSETSQKLQATLAEVGEAARSMVEALRKESENASASHIDRENRATAQMEGAVTNLNTNIEALISTLGQKVDGVVGTLQTQSDAAAAAQVERELRMQEHAENTIGQMTQKIEAVMTAVKSIAQEIRASIDAMRTTTTDVVGRMNSGAETMYLAASEFKDAGKSVTGVLQESSTLVDKLGQAAGAVNSSTQTLQSIVADYANVRTTLSEMLEGLRSTVENAKRDASLTADVLQKIGAATTALGKAQQDAEEYLQQVSKVLVESHTTFHENLKTSLSAGYQEFYQRLSAATGMLRTAIEELALAVENPSAVRK